jgi:DNA polymerase
MENLHLDYETRSELNLPEVGLDRYCSHPSTGVILGAFCFGDGPVTLWSPHLSSMPQELWGAFHNPKVKIYAWHSPFERLITEFCLGITIPPNRFIDPNINARYISLPGYLDECGEILKIPQDKQKMAEGERLKKMFCIPAKAGGQDTLFGISKPIFRDHETDPKDWELFGQYCIRDVEAEREIWKRMEKFRLLDEEWDTFYLDQMINDRGMYIDLDLVHAAIHLSEQIKTELTEKLFRLTGLDNPNSRDQMLEWCRSEGYTYHALSKNFVNQALAGKEISDKCREALTIRQQAAKTSDTKYDAILREVSGDSRLRHQYRFMGAARTHRWASGGSS